MWRLRLVGVLLRVRVYIPGAFLWAARGIRVDMRVGHMPWEHVPTPAVAVLDMLRIAP